MNDNPAFPQTCLDASDVGMVHTGMSLRDYFAAKSLIAISGLWDGIDKKAADRTAKAAYLMADAMLAARIPQECEASNE